jgi:ATP-dependent protease ClpP protease subunit
MNIGMAWVRRDGRPRRIGPPLDRARHRRLIAALLCAGCLGYPCAEAISADVSPRTSAARTSRWWKLTCSDKPAPCVFTVRLRGIIDQSRLRLFQEALRRRDTEQRALGRIVALHVDVDSPGGQVFYALEIGRLLRREAAPVRMGPGAVCVSACVFVLMGATEREVAADARIGLHRPSLGDPRRDALVPSMAEQMAQYAEEMGVSRRIVEEMVAIPSSRVRFVTVAELARYGLSVSIVR